MNGRDLKKAVLNIAFVIGVIVGLIAIIGQLVSGM